MLLIINLMAKAEPSPKGEADKEKNPGKSTRLVIKLMAKIITPITMRRANVFNQRLRTNLLLRPKLLNAPFCSMIIAGTTKESIIIRIIPGITNSRNPTMTKMPITIDATKREGSLETVKLKLP